MKNRNVEDAAYTLLDGLGRLLLGGGALALVIGVAFMFFYAFRFGSGTGDVGEAENALKLVGIFGTVLTAGSLATAIGAAILFWGEELTGIAMVIGAAVLFFAPVYIPMLMGGDQAPGEVAAAALGQVQRGGLALGAIGFFVFGVDIVQRVQSRVKHGSKADTMKYGKGMKQETDYQNRLLGKCWQMPYCRKYVREKCPIYHSGRTCWKERVGCMCEEKVIANAMSGINIPKDAIAAAKFIPYDNKLPMELKRERCKQCIIFNEHQRHKYKIALPAILFGTIGFYVLMRDPLKAMFRSIALAGDRFVNQATFNKDSALDRADQMGVTLFQEVLAVALMLIVMAYLLKLAEYLFFKAKV